MSDTTDPRRGRAWSRMFARAGSALALLALIAIAVRMIHKPAAAPEEEEKEPTIEVAARVARAARESIAQQVRAVGSIVPRLQATIGAKVQGQIKSMALLRNKTVSKGEVLAVIDTSDVAAQRDEARAALEEARLNARSTQQGTSPQADAGAQKDLRDARATEANARAIYERRKTLYAQGGIAKKDLEASELAWTTARSALSLAQRTMTLRSAAISPAERAVADARIKQAEQHLRTLDVQIDFASVRAPFAGVVTDQFQYAGEYVQPGAKLVAMASMNDLIVKAPLADVVAAQLSVGDAADVAPAERPGATLAGHVALVSRLTDPASRTVEVWVTLPRGIDLRAYGAAEVTFATRQAASAIVVPASAVTLDQANGSAGTVMVVDAASTAHVRHVATGIRSVDRVQITSGLAQGETIVVEGAFALPDGTRIATGEGSPSAAPTATPSAVSSAGPSASPEPGEGR